MIKSISVVVKMSSVFGSSPVHNHDKDNCNFTIATINKTAKKTN